MERIIKVDFGSGAEEVAVCDNKYVEPDDEYFAWEREYIKSISQKINNDYLVDWETPRLCRGTSRV